ncbi:MAG: electron transport complex protein RnfA [Vulcanimicrobiota bacterium]
MENNFFGELFTILISAILINNFVLTKFLGLCTFVGVSKKVEPSVGLGIAVIFVMGGSSLITAVLYNFILKPLNIEYMKIVVFIIVIASLVQLVEIYTRKMLPDLFKSLGVYLVITATNCAVLAAPLLNSERYTGKNFADIAFSTVHGIAAGAGFALAIVLLSYIRERLELADVPEALQGLPITFITTGLMAIAFMGFTGLIKV